MLNKHLAGWVLTFALVIVLSACADPDAESANGPSIEPSEATVMNESDPAAGESSDGDQPVAEEATDSDGESALAESAEEETIAELPDEPLILVDKVEPLTLEPHESVSRNNFFTKGAFPLNTPYYGKDLRMQVVEYNDHFVELEIGNTSDKPMVLTDENLVFRLIDGVGQDISKSTLQGSPVTIEPNTIKTVKVTKAPRAVRFHFMYGHLDGLFGFPLKSEITDTEPLEEYFMSGLMADESYMVLGNGKFKFQAKEVLMTANKTIKGIHVGDEGRILLIKLQLANTSDEVLKLIGLTAHLNDFINEEIENLPEEVDIQDVARENIDILLATEMISEQVEIPLSALDWLGDLAFPREVAPHTIAEGYIPAIMKDINQVNNLVIETNLGTFYFGNINNFSLW